MSLDNAELLARFQAEHMERHSISEKRRAACLRELGRLAARLDGRTLAEITPSDLMAWQGAELKRGLAPTTVAQRQTMLRAFITWANTAGLISFEATARLKSVPKVRGSGDKRINPRPYKRQEIERFREALDAKYPMIGATGKGSRAIKMYLRGQIPFREYVLKHARRLQFEAQVSLALEEGLRRGEIFGLTLPQLAPDNAAVVVLSAKSKPGEKRWREVPFTAHSRLCLQEWLEFRRLMVPAHERPWLKLKVSDPSGPQGWRHFGRSLRLIKGDWQWHRFRHTFATERLRAGLPLEKLQIMMGHANTQQTLAYAEIVSADVQIEADRTAEQFARNLGLVA